MEMMITKALFLYFFSRLLLDHNIKDNGFVLGFQYIDPLLGFVVQSVHIGIWS